MTPALIAAILGFSFLGGLAGTITVVLTRDSTWNLTHNTNLRNMLTQRAQKEYGAIGIANLNDPDGKDQLREFLTGRNLQAGATINSLLLLIQIHQEKMDAYLDARSANNRQETLNQQLHHLLHQQVSKLGNHTLEATLTMQQQVRTVLTRIEQHLAGTHPHQVEQKATILYAEFSRDLPAITEGDQP